MYRLLAIAKYEERYVIPSAYEGPTTGPPARGAARAALDVDGGPGMVGSGPVRRGSGRPVPVAVETFHALRERQTGEGMAANPGEPVPGQPAELGRQGPPRRAVPAADATGITAAPRPAADAGRCSATRLVCCRPPRCACSTPTQRARRCCRWSAARSTSCRPGAPGPADRVPRHRRRPPRRPVRPQHYVEVFDTAAPLLALPDLVDRRRDPPPRRRARRAQGRYRAAGARARTAPSCPTSCRPCSSSPPPPTSPAASRCCRSTGAALELLRACAARGGHALRRARRGGLRAAAGAVARRRRGGEGAGPQRATAGAGRARPRPVPAAPTRRRPR